MASKSKDTIIVRVPSSVKRAARKACKKDGITLTDFIIYLIEQFALRSEGAKP